MAKIGPAISGRYELKQYSGSFATGSLSTQYQNKPQPQWPLQCPPAKVCDIPDCPICKPKKKPVTGRHYTGIIMDDLTEDEQMARCNYACRKCHDPNCAIRNKPKKEVEMSEDKSYEYQHLYEVITTYGADRDEVIVKRIDVVAETEERARMQAAGEIEKDWDLDYVEQDVQAIAEIRVKRKPRETKEAAE